MERLAWLPVHSDFRAALKTARGQVDPAARLRELTRLAGYDRDFIATEQLDRALTSCATELGGLEQAAHPKLTAARIALLSSHTVDHLVPALRVAGLQRRLAIAAEVAPYGMVRQQLLGEDAVL